MTTFRTQPFDESTWWTPDGLVGLLEDHVENTCEAVAAQRIKDGWTNSQEQDDSKQLHPCLFQFEHLPYSEREYDCNTAGEPLHAVITLGRIVHIYN